MTAEIAILNKYAVALAADSAVTISAGDKDEKIFDSADKIFELSRSLSIGVMIYNGMDFVEIPFQTIICNFRDRNGIFQKVEAAARSFLAYLNEVGEEAPEKVKDDDLYYILSPLINGINTLRRKRIDSYFDDASADKVFDDIRAELDKIPGEIISEYKARFESYENATFFGAGELCFDEAFDHKLEKIIRENLEFVPDDYLGDLSKLCKLRLSKKVLSNNHTGIIIAGFGAKEIFPTIFSYEIDGMVCNRLKYSKTNSVDIDRLGRRAAVIPFAQKEMVERFLYGMDINVERSIFDFCREAIEAYRTSILERIDVDDVEQKSILASEAKAGEDAFLKGLTERAFESIRTSSRHEIEAMVEFMPKPELAKMAEALVNLTSIKRRVSRGFETVGGPIDVAVISRTEGFIWVKRKHYFDAELNVRYINRVRGLKRGATKKGGKEGANA